MDARHASGCQFGGHRAITQVSRARPASTRPPVPAVTAISTVISDRSSPATITSVAAGSTLASTPPRTATTAE